MPQLEFGVGFHSVYTLVGVRAFLASLGESESGGMREKRKATASAGITESRQVADVFRSEKMRGKYGFALLQISIVGVFLGTVASVFAPSLAAVRAGSKEAQFISDLQTIRSQVELYRIQHGQLPPTTDIAAFKTAMTQRGEDGYGPYLQRIPANPFSGDSTVRFEHGASTAGSGKAGWVLNETSGHFQADDSAKHAAF